jgi:hypothetical protein
MTTIAFDERSPTAGLLCPECKNPYLHHEAISVYEREREDAPSRVLTLGCSLRNPSRILETDERRAGPNPSMRRNGIAIRFWCENCHSISELTLAQHKGTSELGWRPVGRILERWG